jgi:hypothetical protein
MVALDVPVLPATRRPELRSDEAWPLVTTRRRSCTSRTAGLAHGPGEEVVEI